MISAPVITLEARPGGGLRATLRNGSGAPLRVLHDARLQPSTLRLVGADGQSPVPFDERTREKFDATVRASSYRVIPGGGALVLCEVCSRPGARGFDLRWPPYVFRGLSAGRWRAAVVWTSAVDTFEDAKGQTARLSDVWLGEVISNEVTLVLP